MTETERKAHNARASARLFALIVQSICVVVLCVSSAAWIKIVMAVLVMLSSAIMIGNTDDSDIVEVIEAEWIN